MGGAYWNLRVQNGPDHRTACVHSHRTSRERVCSPESVPSHTRERGQRMLTPAGEDGRFHGENGRFTDMRNVSARLGQVAVSHPLYRITSHFVQPVFFLQPEPRLDSCQSVSKTLDTLKSSPMSRETRQCVLSGSVLTRQLPGRSGTRCRTNSPMADRVQRFTRSG